MSQTKIPDTLAGLLCHLTAEELRPVTALTLYLRVAEVKSALAELQEGLCNRLYGDQATAFLATCRQRGVTPGAAQFQAWLMLNSDLPGWLVTVFSERLDQDLADKVEHSSEEPEIDSLLRILETRRQARHMVLPVATELPPVADANALVPSPVEG